MNYTYEQFLKEAQRDGLWDQFSDADKRLAQENPDAGMSLLSYKRDYRGATSEQARLLANAGAEGIRKQYGGYTGGSDGSGYRLGGGGNGSFNSAANEQANVMLKLLESREPYSYDAKSDPAAQSYRKQYAREGQRAVQDTMGAYAAMTGGTPNTAAVTAAQQAGNRYAAQGADKAAELEQMAYDRYLAEGDQMRQTWSMYRDQADAEYNRWLNEENLRSQAEQMEYQRRYNEAVLAAQYGDYSGLKALGINPNAYASGGYSYSDGGSEKQGEDEPAGLSEAMISDLRMMYADGNVDAGMWQELAAAYGEEALTAAGFRLAGDPDAARKASAGAAAGEKVNAALSAIDSALQKSLGSNTGGPGNAQNNRFRNEAQSLRDMYPNGILPGTVYDNLVNTYGASAVAAEGFTRGG